MKGIKCQMV